MADEQCPFCQLIANPDQLYTVGETDSFYAWLEVNPRAKGHTMIVPKEHTESVLDFSKEEWQEAMKLAREVAEKAKNGLDADGVSITVNVEEAGGQMLPHAYIQVFPRFKGEENAGTPTGAIFPQKEALREQLDDIQQAMSDASTVAGGKREAHPAGQGFTEGSIADKLLEGGLGGGRTGKEEEIPEPEESGDGEEEEEPEEPEKRDDEQEEESADEEGGRNRSGHWDGKSYEWR